MTGAAVVPATSATITAALAANRASQRAILGKRQQARQVRDGNTDQVLKWDLEDLKAEEADLSAQLGPLLEQEQAAAQRALAERQQREMAQAQQAQARAWVQVTSALDALAIAAGAYRRAVEVVAQMEAGLTGNPERRRVVIHRDSGGGAMELAGATLASWLDAEPGVELNLGVLDQLSGSVGELKRSLRAAFFKP